MELELSERGVLNQGPEIVAVVKQLKALGVRISIDDFGTGYSSLGHINNYPFNKIKVDRSFVANIVNQSADRDACAAIVALAQKLGMRTIAEGVETEKQAQFLLTEGCTFLQGFLTCMPTTVEGMLDVLSTGQSS